jgi:hypothetical protein
MCPEKRPPGNSKRESGRKWLSFLWFGSKKPVFGLSTIAPKKNKTVGLLQIILSFWSNEPCILILNA